MILEKLLERTGFKVEFVRVGVELESKIRDSAHLWWINNLSPPRLRTSFMDSP